MVCVNPFTDIFAIQKSIKLGQIGLSTSVNLAIYDQNNEKLTKKANRFWIKRGKCIDYAPLHNSSLLKLQFILLKQQDYASMPSVRIKENEPFDVALRRFKRSCEKAGILAKVRSKEFYEKPTWERKRKGAAAVSVTSKGFTRVTKFQRLY